MRRSFDDVRCRADPRTSFDTLRSGSFRWNDWPSLLNVRKYFLASAIALTTGIALFVLLAKAQTHQHGAPLTASTAADTRQLVKFPEPMRLHTIASMRDHLFALQEINTALSKNDFDKAASVAEQRLGMSSLERHGAGHIAPYMPEAMQEIGTQMHRAASRFALEAQSASVSNDVRPALAALGAVMQQCVACHAAYRLH
jgi:hypothetical protein